MPSRRFNGEAVDARPFFGHPTSRLGDRKIISETSDRREKSILWKSDYFLEKRPFRVSLGSDNFFGVI